MNKEINLYQFQEPESSTYTYILADEQSREAVIIDPVIETVSRDVSFIQSMGLTLKYIIDTHLHADHITGSGELRRRTGAKITLSSEYHLSCPDIALNDGDELSFGSFKLKALSTPGHTAGCMSFYVEGMIFTGDCLLIRGCGRTDFQEGNSRELFYSVREKLFSLPDETIVYPAHDYKGKTSSTIGEEKTDNPRLNLSVTEEAFVTLMENLNFAYPKKILESIPANKLCGHGEQSSNI